MISFANQTAHKFLVNFQDVHGDVMQEPEGSIFCSKIIHRNLKAEFSKLIKLAGKHLCIIGIAAFRKFYHDKPRIYL